MLLPLSERTRGDESVYGKLGFTFLLKINQLVVISPSFVVEKFSDLLLPLEQRLKAHKFVVVG
jgi:hypothetical protein